MTYSYEIADKSPQEQFEGHTSMSGVITLWELLTKYQTIITFLKQNILTDDFNQHILAVALCSCLRLHTPADIILCDCNGVLQVDDNMPPAPRYKHNLAFTTDTLHRFLLALLCHPVVIHEPLCYGHWRCNISPIWTWMDPWWYHLRRIKKPFLRTPHYSIPGRGAIGINVEGGARPGCACNQPSEVWTIVPKYWKQILSEIDRDVIVCS